MPRYLVQTSSGSWYQVDTDEPKVLRLSKRAIPGIMTASDAWQDMKVTAYHHYSDGDIIKPHESMRFFSNGAWVTTAPVISRVIIEDISKRRSVPA